MIVYVKPDPTTVVKEYRSAWHEGMGTGAQKECRSTVAWLSGYYILCPICRYEARLASPEGGQTRRDIA